MSKKRKAPKFTLMILLILIILIIGFTIYIAQNKQNSKHVIEEVLSNVQNIEANLTEYIVYGTHLNIKGEIKDEISEIQEVSMILAGADKEENKMSLKYEEDKGKIKFSTSDLINKGIDLENLSVR